MTPPRTSFVLGLLGACALSLAPALHPWSANLHADRSGSLLTTLLGDGRRLFANHFFAKADAYFHRGLYPSIFDPPRQEEMHMASEGTSASDDHHEGHAEESHDEERCTDPNHNHAPAPAPTDWIAWMNSQLIPSDHAHLDQGDTREMLPWLKLSAELDPSNPQNYTITSYWLRSRLNRIDEAEQFLRQGLRHNPGSPEILFELGVLQFENRSNSVVAANLLAQALHHWEQRPRKTNDPDMLLGSGILVRLAVIETDRTNYPAALDHLRKLRDLSPNPEAIDAEIAELQRRINSPTNP